VPIIQADEVRFPIPYNYSTIYRILSTRTFQATASLWLVTISGVDKRTTVQSELSQSQKLMYK